MLPHPLLWPMYVFTFFAAGLYTFNRPALDTWPARLLDRELLPSSNALDAGFGTFAGMLGPVAAGFLLVAIKPAGVYLFDVATFAVVILAIRLMRPSPPAHEDNEVSWAAVKAGFRFLKGKRNVQSVFLADLNAMIFGFPMALLPAIAFKLSATHPAQYLGYLYAAPAAGAFLATLLSGRAKDVRRQGRAIMLSIVVWGGAIVVFGLSHALWLSLVMLAIAGAGDMVSGIFRLSIIQAAVEDRFRGRLEGIGMAVWATGPALGDFESGAVATLTTPAISIVSGGLITIAAIAVLVFGIWIVAVSAWNFTDTWVLLGLAGIAVTIATGAGFLGPESVRLGKLSAERDPSDPEIQRRIKRIFAVSRVILVVLILVVADMVFKPGS